MSDGTREWVIGLVGGAAGWLLSVIKGAFQAGERNARLVTHKQLEEKLSGYARKDQLEDVKKSIENLEKRSEDRHAQIIDILVGGKE